MEKTHYAHPVDYGHMIANTIDKKREEARIEKIAELAPYRDYVESIKKNHIDIENDFAHIEAKSKLLKEFGYNTLILRNNTNVKLETLVEIKPIVIGKAARRLYKCAIDKLKDFS